MTHANAPSRHAPYTGPERRLKDDPLIPQWEERRGRTRPSASDEATAFDHEHGRLYEALKTAEERAELAGDNDIAGDIRILRKRVWEHLAEGRHA